jgi:multidrug efflux pump subunit AcrA (membrane-fusion protein)
MAATTKGLNKMTTRFVLHRSLAALLLAGLLAGCSEGPAAPSGEDTLAVPEVSIVELQPAPLAVIRDLPGRIAPTRIAEVRARVSGIVVNRNFEQGSDVKAESSMPGLSKSMSMPRKPPSEKRLRC